MKFNFGIIDRVNLFITDIETLNSKTVPAKPAHMVSLDNTDCAYNVEYAYRSDLKPVKHLNWR